MLASVAELGPPYREITMGDENCGWAIAWRIVTLIWWGDWLLCAFGVVIGQAIAFNGGPAGIDRRFCNAWDWMVWPSIIFIVAGLICRPNITIPVLLLNWLPIFLIAMRLLCLLLIGFLLISAWECS